MQQTRQDSLDLKELHEDMVKFRDYMAVFLDQEFTRFRDDVLFDLRGDLARAHMDFQKLLERHEGFLQALLGTQMVGDSRSQQSPHSKHSKQSEISSNSQHSSVSPEECHARDQEEFITAGDSQHGIPVAEEYAEVRPLALPSPVLALGNSGLVGFEHVASAGLPIKRSGFDFARSANASAGFPNDDQVENLLDQNVDQAVFDVAEECANVRSPALGITKLSYKTAAGVFYSLPCDLASFKDDVDSIRPLPARPIQSPVVLDTQLLKTGGAAPPAPSNPRLEAVRASKRVFGMHVAFNKVGLAKKEYDVSSFYKKSGCAQAVARSTRFQEITFGAILLNILFIGIDQDLNPAGTLVESPWPWVLFELCSCVFFMFELSVRFLAFRVKGDCLKDNWFKFDALLMVLTVSDSCLVPFMSVSVGWPSVTGSPATSFLSLLRLAWLTRLTRSLPELVTMMKSLRSACRPLVNCMAMLSMLVYIFGVVLHTCLAAEESLHEYFKSLRRCLWTLVTDGIFLDSTGIVLGKLQDAGRHDMVALFVTFIICSAMLLMNMVGVFCEVVSTTAQREKDFQAISLLKNSLLLRLEDQDVDKRGTVSCSGMRSAVMHPEANAVLQDLQINIDHLLDYTSMLFEEGDGELPVSDIINVVLKLRGDTPSRAEDTINGIQLMYWKMSKMMDAVSSEIDLRRKVEHV